MKQLARSVLFMLLVAAGLGWWAHHRLVTPYGELPPDGLVVELPPGSGVSGIAARLVAAGVIPDSLTFRLAAYLSDSERKLQAGEYQFVAPASPSDIVDRLRRGDVFARAVTFPEGLTIHEMADIFGRSGLGTAAEFATAAADGSLAGAFDPEAATLEGYLFPDTYAFARHVGADGAVRAMLSRFGQAFDAPLREAASSARLSPREVVTLASLVEKETAAPDERPIVAAVYRNRLRIGMLLQCDPTVIYALMRAGRWRGNLTRKDLEMASPYNTYRVAGLPPGPIASPGRASLDAALHPADVPYLYFVSRNDGTHVFATTLAEHQRNVVRWQQAYWKKH